MRDYFVMLRAKRFPYVCDRTLVANWIDGIPYVQSVWIFNRARTYEREERSLLFTFLVRSGNNGADLQWICIVLGFTIVSNLIANLYGVAKREICLSSRFIHTLPSDQGQSAHFLSWMWHNVNLFLVYASVRITANWSFVTFSSHLTPASCRHTAVCLNSYVSLSTIRRHLNGDKDKTS